MTDFLTIPALALTADLARYPGLGAAIATAIGTRLPGPGQAAGGVLGQGPSDWLLLCDDPAGLARRLEALGPVLATPLALAEFHLDADQLASGTAVRPPPGHCAVTRYAQLRVTILAGTDDFRLFVDLPVARHVALWLARLDEGVGPTD